LRGDFASFSQAQATGLSDATAHAKTSVNEVKGAPSEEDGAASNPAITVTRDEDFEACLEHALGLMVKEVSAMKGESVENTEIYIQPCMTLSESKLLNSSDSPSDEDKNTEPCLLKELQPIQRNILLNMSP
jgi:hypothetical protein